MIIQVDMVKNIRGNFWVRVKGEPAFYLMPDKLDGKWILAQRGTQMPVAIPSNSTLLMCKTDAHHYVYQIPELMSLHSGNSICEGAIIVTETQQVGDTFFGELHMQSLCCHEIESGYSWVMIQNIFGSPFELLYS